MYSADRKYTHDHLWISLEGSHGTVGITDHAKKNLCPLTAVELPEVGRSLSRQEAFGTLEAAKALSEMLAPVSGKVVAVNTDLSAHPERLCDDPNGTWIIKLEIADPAEASSLLSSAQYAQAVTSPPSARERKPKSAPKKRSEIPKPQPTAKSQPKAESPSPPVTSDDLIAATWSMRLRNTKLRGGDEAFGDRDYSGGSYFSWREREIVLVQDHRFVWQDTSFTRVSTAGLSSTVPSHKRYQGTWKITVVAGSPRLVFEDNVRGVQTFRVEASTRGQLLLDSKPYSWSRL